MSLGRGGFPAPGSSSEVHLLCLALPCFLGLIMPVAFLFLELRASYMIAGSSPCIDNPESILTAAELSRTTPSLLT